MSDDKNTNEALHISELPHNALSEFGRDERRPAVLLLGALVIAAIFFAIGIMVGRLTGDNNANTSKASPALNNSPVNTSSPPSLNPPPSVQTSPQTMASPQTSQPPHTSPTPKSSSKPLTR
jgi:cytoskeletal protein RodZ